MEQFDTLLGILTVYEMVGVDLEGRIAMPMDFSGVQLKVDKGQ